MKVMRVIFLTISLAITTNPVSAESGGDNPLRVLSDILEGAAQAIEKPTQDQERNLNEEEKCTP